VNRNAPAGAIWSGQRYTRGKPAGTVGRSRQSNPSQVGTVKSPAGCCPWSAHRLDCCRAAGCPSREPAGQWFPARPASPVASTTVRVAASPRRWAVQGSPCSLVPPSCCRNPYPPWWA